MTKVNPNVSVSAIDGNDTVHSPLKRSPKAKKRNQTSNVSPDAKVSAIVGRDPMPSPLKGSPKARELTDGTGILSILTDHVEVFHTSDGTPYATIAINGKHEETWAVHSTYFQNYLARCFYQSEQNAMKTQALKEAINLIEAIARFEGGELPVFTRVAESDGNIYLDLGDPAWQVVEITPSGWSIVSHPPVRFRRGSGMLALPVPVHGGHISDLRPFVNVKEDDWVLFVSWLVAAFQPKGPYPILGIYGEQGSAKTTTERVARHLVDPFKAPMRTMPRSERDFMITASNSYIVTLDNLSHLAPWLSDALCRLATGGGMGTRKLYTDEEEIIFEVKRPVLLNGIDDVAVNGDVLDRMILLSLPEITEVARKEEAVFWKEFEEVRPRILGALLSGVSAALNNRQAVKLEKKPRMADFAIWASAAEGVLGFKAGEFSHAYNRNRKEASDIALELSPAAIAVYEFMQKKTEWKGTFGQLLKSINGFQGQPGPTTPKAFSSSLERSKPNLRNAGITIHRLPREAGTGRRLIRLVKKAEALSQSSQTSQAPSDHNVARDGGRDASSDGIGMTEAPFSGGGDDVTVRDGRSQSGHLDEPKSPTPGGKGARKNGRTSKPGLSTQGERGEFKSAKPGSKNRARTRKGTV